MRLGFWETVFVEVDCSCGSRHAWVKGAEPAVGLESRGLTENKRAAVVWAMQMLENLPHAHSPNNIHVKAADAYLAEGE